MRWTSCLAVFLVFSMSAAAQDVIVSEYYKVAGPFGQGTEILVVKDNLNMVGWVLSDNNTDQTERQGGVKFKDVPLWRNLRAGTIIVVWHRGVVPKDADHRDGYIEIEAQNRTYFDAFPDENYFNPINGPAFNVAAPGDILEVFDADLKHVHGLGHKATPGPYYDSMPAPKVNTLFGCANGQSNMVLGRSLAAYAADRTTDSARIGNVVDPDTSLGFPNLHPLSDDRNVRFWRELREPSWTSSPAITITQQVPNAHTFTWTPISEPNAADSIQGYVIVRDTLDFASATAPIDGTIYAAGDRLGTARILAVRPTIAGTSFTDTDNIVCGGRYTYRVYGYRFRKDDRRVNTPPATTRGRQYTTLAAQSAQITKALPSTPVVTASTTSICPGDPVVLSTTASAPTYVWSKNGVPQPLPNQPSVTVREAGTWSLTIIAEGGCTATSADVVINVKPAPTVDISPAAPQRICDGESIILRTATAATSYEWFRNGQLIPGAIADSLIVSSAGQYYVRAAVTNGCPGISAVVTVSTRSITASLSATSIDFGVLGECETSRLRSITITNTSTESVTLNVVSMPTGYALSSPPPGTIMQAGASMELRFRFAPPGLGVFNGTAVVRLQPCGVDLNVSLQGSRSTPSVSVDKALVDFGTFTTCSDVPGIAIDSIFRIVNSGASDVTVRAPLVAPPFYVAGSFPRVVPSGSSIDITVQYSPLGVDTDRGVTQDIAFPFESLSCRDTVRSTVSAASFRARAELVEDTVGIGTVSSCAPTKRITVLVRNTGGASVTVVAASHTGVTLANGPVLIAANSTEVVELDVDLTGSPDGPVTLTGVLRADPCSLQMPLVISGRVESVDATIASTSHEFGTINSCDADLTARAQNRIILGDTVSGTATIVSVTSTRPEFTTTLLSGVVINGTVPFLITYAPTSDGVHTGTISIILGPCPDTLVIDVRGTFRTVAAAVTQGGADFGTLTPGQTAQRTVSISNTGAAPIRVESPTDVVPPFYVVSSTTPLPTDLAAGTSVQYTVEYRHTGSVSDDTLRLVNVISAPCSRFDTLRFVGRSRDTATAPLDAEIVIPTTLVGRPGVNVTVPIHLRSASSVAPANATVLTLDLSYNPTLLRPVSASSPKGGSVSLTDLSSGSVRVRIETTGPLEATDSLILVQGMVYLGDAAQTPIAIENATASGLTLSGRDGLLSLEGPCLLSALQGGVGGPVTMSVRAQHQDQVEVQISTLTHDAVRLDLFDATGAWHGTVLDQRLQPGTWSIPVSTTELPAGFYVIRMVHGRFVRSLGIFAQ